MIDQSFEDDIRFSTFIEDEFKCKCHWKGSYDNALKDTFQNAIQNISYENNFFIGTAFNQHLSPIPGKFGLYVKINSKNEFNLWKEILNKVNKS
jgi:hypothetical protein